MNEHAGPACALSVLIVGVFAVLLHDKNSPAAPPRPTGPGLTSTALAPAPVSPQTIPILDDRARRATLEAERPIAITPTPTPTAEIRPAEHPAISPPRATVKPKPMPVPKASPIRPRSSTTIVEAGENLADVAARTYGAPEAAESIWKANRDQLAGLDSPLTGGMLLRTP